MKVSAETRNGAVLSSLRNLRFTTCVSQHAFRKQRNNSERCFGTLHAKMDRNKPRIREAQ